MPTETTPNMLIEKPAVSETTGPDWGTKLNAALDTVDAHDHSDNKGVRITQAGIRFTDEFSASLQRIKDLLAVRLIDNGTDPGSMAGDFFMRDGDLWFKDGDDTAIQITSNGTLNFGLAGGFTGDYGQPGVEATALYTASTSLFEFIATVGPTVYAHLKFRDLIREGAMKRGTDSVATLAGNITLTDSDHKEVLLVDTTAPRNVTLPAASASKRVVILKDKSGQAMTNNISVIPNGTDTIEGLNATKALATNWGSWTLQSDGTSAWYFL